MEKVSESKCFGGSQGVYTHHSAATGTPMTFQVFLPEYRAGEKLPVLWWLSGLTCTHENAMIKCHYHRACAEHGVALIGPDSSPRGDDVPDDEDARQQGEAADRRDRQRHPRAVSGCLVVVPVADQKEGENAGKLPKDHQ